MPVDVKLVVAIPVDRINEVAAQAVLCFSNRNAVAHDECDKAKQKRCRHNQPIKRIRAKRAKNGGEPVNGRTVAEDRSELRKVTADQWSKVNKAKPQVQWQDRIFSAASLQHEVFPPIAHVVPGLLPDGLSMLVGRPKIGKSWMALEIAIASATGGTCLGGIPVEKGDVLYCACEDSERRLQSRITKVLGARRKDWPIGLHFTTGWKRLDKGGVTDILEWINTVDNPRLVILDTLASVKPIRATTGYQEDYSALESLHRLANDLGIAILVLHHQRKNEADDPLDTISGTLGLAGCVDTPIILAGTPQGMTLYVRGRDIEEAEHAVTFDKETCRWTIMGEAAEVHRSDTRKKILTVLQTAKQAMGPSDIAAAADLKESVVKVRLGGMARDGEVTKVGRGLYAHPSAVKQDKKDA